MNTPHFTRKGELSQFPEIATWTLNISPNANAIEPEDLLSMLMDHAVTAPGTRRGLCVSAFGVSYLIDVILMVSRPGEKLVIVTTVGEAEALLTKQ